MGSLYRTLGATILVIFIQESLCITKNFVNNSMPEMRPTFVVNFDMSTVICQHSADPADLHLHQMSILCDGKSDCFSNPAMHDESFPYCEGRCNSTCNHRGACLFDGVRGQCYCNAGYHGPNCEYRDFNECEDKPCHWLAHCQNTLGSYYCTCFPGFQGNGHDCSDIDECELGIAQCPENSVCVNLPGTYFCNCTEGFQQLGLPAERCADIDECEQNLHDCPANLKCQNEIGSYKCVEECGKGFRTHDDTCVDVDECSEKTALCDKRATCINTVGGYKCKCEEGFAGDGHTCSPIYDCSQQDGICDRHAFCLGSMRMCICHPGYAGDGLNCYDVNECETKADPCEKRNSERCLNIDGGYICCSNNKTDDQCIRDKGAFCSGGCGRNAVCYNETCKCMEGYEGDPKIKCDDVNECENDKQCPGVGEWCVNMEGGYTCCDPDSKEFECLTKGLVGTQEAWNGGYMQKSEGSASEKSSGGFILTNAKTNMGSIVNLPCDKECPRNSRCTNGICQCNDGFFKNAEGECEDTDECQQTPCTQPNSWCVNTVGGFRCCTPESRAVDCLELITNGRLTGQMQIPGKYSTDQTQLNSTKSVGEQNANYQKEAGGWKTELFGEWKNLSGGAIILGRKALNGKEGSGLFEVATVEQDETNEPTNKDQELGLEISGRGLSGGGGIEYKIDVVNGVLQTSTTTAKPQIDVYLEGEMTAPGIDQDEAVRKAGEKINVTDSAANHGTLEQKSSLSSVASENSEGKKTRTGGFVKPDKELSEKATTEATQEKEIPKDELTTADTQTPISPALQPNKTLGIDQHSIPKECIIYLSEKTTTTTTEKPHCITVIAEGITTKGFFTEKEKISSNETITTEKNKVTADQLTSKDNLPPAAEESTRASKLQTPSTTTDEPVITGKTTVGMNEISMKSTTKLTSLATAGEITATEIRTTKTTSEQMFSTGISEKTTTMSITNEDKLPSEAISSTFVIQHSEVITTSESEITSGTNTTSETKMYLVTEKTSLAKTSKSTKSIAESIPEASTHPPQSSAFTSERKETESVFTDMNIAQTSNLPTQTITPKSINNLGTTEKELNFRSQSIEKFKSSSLPAGTEMTPKYETTVEAGVVETSTLRLGVSDSNTKAALNTVSKLITPGASDFISSPSNKVFITGATGETDDVKELTTSTSVPEILTSSTEQASTEAEKKAMKTTSITSKIPVSITETVSTFSSRETQTTIGSLNTSSLFSEIPASSTPSKEENETPLNTFSTSPEVLISNESIFSTLEDLSVKTTPKAISNEISNLPTTLSTTSAITSTNVEQVASSTEASSTSKRDEIGIPTEFSTPVSPTPLTKTLASNVEVVSPEHEKGVNNTTSASSVFTTILPPVAKPSNMEPTWVKDALSTMAKIEVASESSSSQPNALPLSTEATLPKKVLTTAVTPGVTSEGSSLQPERLPSSNEATVTETKLALGSSSLPETLPSTTKATPAKANLATVIVTKFSLISSSLPPGSLFPTNETTSPGEEVTEVTKTEFTPESSSIPLEALSSSKKVTLAKEGFVTTAKTEVSSEGFSLPAEVSPSNKEATLNKETLITVIKTEITPETSLPLESSLSRKEAAPDRDLFVTMSKTEVHSEGTGLQPKRLPLSSKTTMAKTELVSENSNLPSEATLSSREPMPTKEKLATVVKTESSSLSPGKLFANSETTPAGEEMSKVTETKFTPKSSTVSLELSLSSKESIPIKEGIVTKDKSEVASEASSLPGEASFSNKEETSTKETLTTVIKTKINPETFPPDLSLLSKEVTSDKKLTVTVAKNKVPSEGFTLFRVTSLSSTEATPVESLATVTTTEILPKGGSRLEHETTPSNKEVILTTEKLPLVNETKIFTRLPPREGLDRVVETEVTLKTSSLPPKASSVITHTLSSKEELNTVVKTVTVPESSTLQSEKSPSNKEVTLAKTKLTTVAKLDIFSESSRPPHSALASHKETTSGKERLLFTSKTKIAEANSSTPPEGIPFSKETTLAKDSLDGVTEPNGAPNWSLPPEASLSETATTPFKEELVTKYKAKLASENNETMPGTKGIGKSTPVKMSLETSSLATNMKTLFTDAPPKNPESSIVTESVALSSARQTSFSEGELSSSTEESKTRTTQDIVNPDSTTSSLGAVTADSQVLLTNKEPGGSSVTELPVSFTPAKIFSLRTEQTKFEDLSSPMAEKSETEFSTQPLHSSAGFTETVENTETVESDSSQAYKETSEPGRFASSAVLTTRTKSVTVAVKLKTPESVSSSMSTLFSPIIASTTIITPTHSEDNKQVLTTNSTNKPKASATTQIIEVTSGGTEKPYFPIESEEASGFGHQPDQVPFNANAQTTVPYSGSTHSSVITEPIQNKAGSVTPSKHSIIRVLTRRPESTQVGSSLINITVSEGGKYEVTIPADNVVSKKDIERTTLEETIRPMTGTLSEHWKTTTEITTQNTSHAVGTESSTDKIRRCYSSDECTNDAYCERRSGVCRCYSGFVGAPPHIPCIDVDECARHLDDCDLTSQCWNFVGGYTCFCNTGFRKLSNGKCIDIDECKERKNSLCHPNAFCLNLPGSYSCQCKPGYTGDGYTCIAIEDRYCTPAELEKYDCGRNHLCLIDRLGRGNCNTCKKGYVIKNGICSDVDECSSSELNGCHENAFCTNIMGSYTCQCLEGYRGDGFWCSDVDECQQNLCHPQASCINTPGSYICKCPIGWIGDGKKSCVNPLDKTCQNKHLACRITNHTSCLSVRIGKLVSVCECDANFRYNPETDRCEDIDECAENRHNCDPSTSVCINTIGGFTCECTAGYEGVGGICVDVDECARDIGGCCAGARCQNHIGSVGCKCAHGYVGNGVDCTLISPMGATKSGCNGEWTTLCRSLNKTCHIDDEEVPQCGSCLVDHHPVNGKCLPLSGLGNCADPRKNDCNVNADCIDVHPGLHYCVCKVGYIGDGRHCDGPNCHLDVSMCHKYAKCKINGKCQCNNGYTGDGVTNCTLVNSEYALNHASNKTVIGATNSSILEGVTRDLGYREEHHFKTDANAGTETTPILLDTMRTDGTLEHVTQMPKLDTLEGVNIKSEEKTNVTGSQTSVIQKCSARDHSPCHVLAHCDIPSGMCVCRPGYYGDGYFTCTKDWQDCSVDNTICDMRAICDFHTRRCRCIEGYIGDGITCEPDALDCMLRQNLCSDNARCAGRRCICTEGYTGDGTTCVPIKIVTDCSLCHMNADCINGACKCRLGYFGNGATCITDSLDCVHFPGICHRNGECDKQQRRCKCFSGFRGDGIDCSSPESCLVNKHVCHKEAECLSSGVCQCKRGFIGDGIFCNAAILVNSEETFAPLKPATLECKESCGKNAVCLNGNCTCADGYHRNEAYVCVDVDECSLHTQCHPSAKCINLPGSYMCLCKNGYRGDGKNCTSQEKIIGGLKVTCETDGMTLILENEMTLVDGRIFVRGQTENPYCSRKFSPLLNSTDHTFKVPYSHCNVRYEEPNTFSVTVVIQRHPMFITHSADAYELKCAYPVGTLEASSRLNVSELATSSSIVEHGSGATCELTVTNENNVVIDTASVGQILRLALSVKPNDTYGILPRNCYAVNLETSERYSLTDKAGCSIDTQLFPEWTYKQPSLITATFRTFKWPDSSMIRFQCDCSACIGACPRVNCGRRREAILRRHKYRYARDADKNDPDDEIRGIVINREPGAFSLPLHIDENEEEKLAQAEMDNWKYQGMTEMEPVGKTKIAEKICIKVIWVAISLLPLLLLIAAFGVLSLLWKRSSWSNTKSVGVVRQKCYNQKCPDNASYLNF